MALVAADHFRHAVDNVSSWGDTDIFPLPFENHVLRDMRPEVVGLLETMCNDYDTRLTVTPPINHSALAPVGYNGFRWATQLDPIWNCYLLGVVLSLAPEIEAARTPLEERAVFSYRYAPESEDASLFRKGSWREFQDRSSQLAQNCKYVVAVDIADFYSRIYHHRIENELKYVDTDGARARQIVQLLMQISKGVSYGLPVGGPAARILAELLLNATDKLLALSDVTFVRYADDYRFFVQDLEEAHRCIGRLSEMLHENEGLSLQRAKTRIFTSTEFLTTVQPEEPRPGSAAKFLSLHLHYDPYSASAAEDYEELKDQLEEFDVVGLLRAELSKGRVDAALTRRLVGVMQYLNPLPRTQAIQSLLENVTTLSPVMPQVLRAIKESLNGLDDNQQDEIHSKLRWLITSNSHVSEVPVNLAYLVRALGSRRSRENESLLAKLWSSAHGYAIAPAPDIQRDIALILANWQANYWLHNIKPHYSTMHEWVQRAFFVASYKMGDEGRHWRGSVRGRLNDFDRIVAEWVQQRAQTTNWTIPL